MDRGIIQQLFRIMLPSTESNGDAKGGEKSAELRLDALRFFRELVTMSKFIMLEKR